MGVRIALAGNPNCGKTTLFNALTGANQFVGNWPGVTVEKKEGKPTFTLYADGHYDFSYNTKNDKPQPSAVYKMEIVSEFDNDRDAKEFAVLKCLEENRIVCPCIVCNNLTRNIEEDDECFIGKIGDVSCKKIKLYKFIRTRISSKYKDAKVKVTSLTPAKDEGTLKFI